MMAPTHVSNAGIGKATFHTHDLPLSTTVPYYRTPLLLSSLATSGMALAYAEEAELPSSLHPLFHIFYISIIYTLACQPTTVDDDNDTADRDNDDDANEDADDDEPPAALQPPMIKPPRVIKVPTLLKPPTTLQFMMPIQSMMMIMPMMMPRHHLLLAAAQLLPMALIEQTMITTTMELPQPMLITTIQGLFWSLCLSTSRPYSMTLLWATDAAGPPMAMQP